MNEDPFGGQGKTVAQVVTNVYIGLLFVVLVCSLANRPAGSKIAYTTVIVSEKLSAYMRFFLST